MTPPSCAGLDRRRNGVGDALGVHPDPAVIRESGRRRSGLICLISDLHTPSATEVVGAVWQLGVIGRKLGYDRNPSRVDKWAYITRQEPIRIVLSEGLARGTGETAERVHEIVGFLSTLGETSYLELTRPSAVE